MNEQPKFPQLEASQATTIKTISLPVVMFFWCNWREKCQELQRLLEELVEIYKEKAVFFWVDADEQGGICRSFSVPDVPLVLLLKDGREKTRFSCSSSGEGIRHNLEALIAQKTSQPAGQ